MSVAAAVTVCRSHFFNAPLSYEVLNGLNNASRSEIGKERVYYSSSSKRHLISQCWDGKYNENEGRKTPTEGRFPADTLLHNSIRSYVNNRQWLLLKFP